MADRSIHYEAAFEAYLRQRGVPYVAVDEAKKALFSTAKLKSFDFVVYNKTGPNLLVDVKGRQLKSAKAKRGFDSWTTERDVEDLMQWEQVFGEGFKAIFTFIYWIDAPVETEEKDAASEAGRFHHRDRWYLLMGVELTDYRNHMRRRSAKWETVSLAAAAFRQLARPIESWL